MNWAVLLIAFGMAVLLASWLDSQLARLRPLWSLARRLLAAALALPMLIVLLTLLGLAWLLISGPGTGENMGDLAIIATVSVGTLFTLLTAIGGLIGARIAGAGRKP